ncbi:MAG: class I SAM-dependent methyltransferase [Treponema sp.]|nr:class I SAM-dependent methyltransferase [Treponema sp.]
MIENEMDSRGIQRHIPTLVSLWRGNGRKEKLDKKEISALSSSLLKLQRGLTGERKMAGGRYMSEKDTFGSYLLYYFPVSYLQIQTVLDFLGNTIEEISKKDEIGILEIGSGPAPGTTALCDRILSLNKNAKISVSLCDTSERAMQTARKILESDFENVRVETKKADIEKNGLGTFGKKPAKFDIVLMSHVLNELWKKDGDKIQRRLSFIKAQAEKLSENGILILNEPAMLESSRNLIKIRDKILQSESFGGMKLIQPCPFSGSKKCPAMLSENQTCHAEKMWKPFEPVMSLAKGAGLDRESVKMSFFVFQKTEEQAEPENGKTLTVVSDGMLNKSGRIRFMLCDGGKRFSLSAKKDDPHAKEIGFFGLRRYDKIRIENPEIREGNFGVAENTEIFKEDF